MDKIYSVMVKNIDGEIEATDKSDKGTDLVIEHVIAKEPENSCFIISQSDHIVAKLRVSDITSNRDVAAYLNTRGAALNLAKKIETEGILAGLRSLKDGAR